MQRLTPSSLGSNPDQKFSGSLPPWAYEIWRYFGAMEIHYLILPPSTVGPSSCRGTREMYAYYPKLPDRDV